MNPILAFYRSPTRTGVKILVTSLVLGALTALPLWLVMQFGPADASATELALLAMFGTIGGLVGAAIGVVWLLIELIIKRR